MTDPLGNDVVKSWDEQGRLASILNRNGLLRTFEYYDDGKLHYERWYDGATTAADLVRTFTWTYTASGQVATASVTDGVDTFTYSYQYNAAGQLIRVEEPFGVIVAFGYDLYGNRNLVRDSLGGEERSVYNASRQLLVRTLTQDGEELRLDFAYDAKGRVATIMRYSDLAGTQLVATTRYAYNDQGNVASIETVDGEDTPISDFDYEWDLAGQLLSQTDFQAGLDPTTHTATYDYDFQGQLTEDGDEEWAYDLLGNRDNYTFNENYTNQLESDGVWDYVYDDEGNMTGKEEIGTDLVWRYAITAVPSCGYSFFALAPCLTPYDGDAP